MFKGKPIAGAIQQCETGRYIVYAVAMPVFPLNSASVWHSEGRVFHANPIIGYADDNSFAVFLFYPYGKMPGYFLTFLQPMGNCIFYQGLKGSFRYQYSIRSLSNSSS